jgi:outer membrane protein, heavy metal efflux system
MAQAPGPAPTPADTLHLTLAESLRLLEETSGRLAAADLRVEAAGAAERQARAFPNPGLSVQVENLGAFEATSGSSGWQGAQGALLLSLPLPLGPERRRGMAVAEAASRLVALDGLALHQALAFQLARTLVELDGAEDVVDLALAEREGWAALLPLLEQGVSEGARAPVELARGRLEEARSAVRLAEAQARAARLVGEVGALLGRAPEVPIRVTLPETCVAPSASAGDARATGDASATASVDPVALAAARAELARAEEARASARRIPRLEPLLGWRREAGVSALVLGMGMELPLFDRRGAALDQARALRAAADREAEAVARETGRQAAALRQAVAALEGAGAAFDDRWRAAMDQAVEAEELAFREGEGSIESLVLARRARVDALETRTRWREELVRARLDLLALEGAFPTASTLCLAVAP